MTHDWPMVPLSEVAKPISRPVQVIAGESYRTIGVKWWGEGAYERETIDGSRTAAKTLSSVREGDLIINKIWVRHGSTAIATKAVDGCAASGEFPTFELDQNQILPRWIHWQTKTRDFWAKCDALSRGTSGKNRIKPELFLTIEIPLPPLDEQRHLVARIEALAVKIEEARGLRRLAVEEAEALVKSNLARTYSSLASSLQTLGDYAVQITDGPHVTPNYVDTGFPFVTVRNIANRRLDLHNLKYITQEDHEMFCRRARPERGDVLYTKDGTLGTPCYVDTDKEFSFFVSVALIKPKRNVLDGRYLAYIVDAPQVHDQVTQNKTGAVLAHIVLRAIKAIQIPVPPLEEQRRIVAYLDGLQARVDALKQLQAQTRVELDALLPSVLDRTFKGDLL